jgi:oligoendopeptidase F
MSQKMRWSLDELYPSFQAQSFRDDIQLLDETINEVKQWAKYSLKSYENPVEKIELYIQKKIQLSQLLSKLMAFTSLTASAEAKNQDALKAIDKLHMKQNELTGPTVIFENWLASLENLDKVIQSSDLLKEHAFFLKKIIERSKFLLSKVKRY